MRTIFLGLFFCTTSIIFAQKIIELPFNTNDNVQWKGGEKAYYSNIWQTDVVTNVSIPTMEVFRPNEPNGTSVIIAPGGGLYALSIKSEGNDVAKWLAEKGITAFVLKYRLVPTAEDGVKEISEEGTSNPQKIMQRVEPVLPLSIEDGLAAIRYVRANASEYNINPQKIGFMGFSAGGAVTMGVVYNYNEDNRPNFIVPVYPWTTALPVQSAPEDAPPMLVICATDDPLGLAAGSVELYSSWLKRNKNAGLHMYSKGGHGFGMKKQDLPSDDWIQRFYDWSELEINSQK
ncbi:alpha/beta hydrolase [Maribacter sp. PR1]|uniref:Alpha/beta hydrolase n=1 Tax=Maribacter cobaltidurans TaxID=1178778 RepID=A0ABU7IXM4_9FLAO|nr:MULTISPECIES: alpha/beta hydrolase [Maribacter]MDC6390288.1 alpha/beta hydrolase [Maribacter sp. PR1]MEE1977678.1 alpha/beta hydrolase [Maribacter cobaltidurans]